MKIPILDNKSRYVVDNDGNVLYKVEPHLSDPSEIIDECKKVADEFKVEIEEVPDA